MLTNLSFVLFLSYKLIIIFIGTLLSPSLSLIVMKLSLLKELSRLSSLFIMTSEIYILSKIMDWTCVSSQNSHVEIIHHFSLPCDGIRKWSLWGVIRVRWSHKGRAFMNRISTLIKFTGELTCFFYSLPEIWMPSKIVTQIY